MKQTLLFLFLGILFSFNGHSQVANQPNDIVLCDSDSDGIALFDLTVLDAQIIGAQTGNFILSYHETQLGADTDVDVIINPTTYQNISNPQTIYARLEDASNPNNYDTTSFGIHVLFVGDITEPSNFEICDDSVNDGQTYFDLESKTPEIIGSSSDVIVTYHETQADAINDTNQLLTPYVNTTPYNQTVYVRIANVENYCFVVTSFDLVIFDCTDNDADSVIDSEEDRNNNGNLDDDDTDGDEIPDYLDDDDDGDNIDTIDEINVATTRAIHPFVDTDGDMIENYIDEDDDGDGVLTKDEDYNNNGDPTDDDTNMNGIPDYLDSAVALNVDEVNTITFELFPNPAKSSITLRVDNQNEFTVFIYNVLGDLVMDDVNKHSIDVSSLKSGLYFVKVKTTSNEEVRKLIIE